MLNLDNELTIPYYSSTTDVNERCAHIIKPNIINAPGAKIIKPLLKDSGKTRKSKSAATTETERREMKLPSIHSMDKVRKFVEVNSWFNYIINSTQTWSTLFGKQSNLEIWI